jgi:hypothetical protein
MVVVNNKLPYELDLQLPVQSVPCDKVCQWLATGPWFSPDPPVSSTNKTDHHDITEILLKVALNTIKQTNMLTDIGSLVLYTCVYIYFTGLL